jgi:predicted secreted Zn-dependent protease
MLEKIPCPFCQQPIEVLHIPSVYSEKHHGKNALGRGISIHKSKEIMEVQNDCQCGKTVKEIQKALKEGVSPDMAKVKQRYNEIMKLKEELKHG